MYTHLMRLLVPGYASGTGGEAAVREKSGRAAGAVGVVTNLLLFALKLMAGLASGSVAVLADAVNNLSDSGSSIIMLVGFRLAGKPADKEHPFGHARIEYLCGVIVSFIVLFLGLELGKSSIEKIIAPEAPDFTALTLLALAASVLIKLWQCGFYRSVGRVVDSPALSATAADSLGDAASTFVVLLGALITRLTSLRLDGWLGLCVAGFIVVSGVRLVIETANPLLGAAPDKELVQSIYGKIRAYPGITGVHDLTVHSYGQGRTFASVHCEVPAEEDILISHDLIDNIERDFLDRDGIHLVIHLDPVVTNDPRARALRELAGAVVKELYPAAAIHDFRVVWGVTHSNVLFDVAVPFGVEESDGEVKQRVAAAIEALDSSYRPVITVDRDGSLDVG